jgi:hypothetical protein
MAMLSGPVDTEEAPGIDDHDQLIADATML